MSRLNNGDLARRGEDLAARVLEAKGYVILERNHRSRRGEIDLIAQDGRCTVFVEVKTRSGPHFTPGEAVDGRKQQRIRALALAWLAEGDRPIGLCRFDVVAVYMRRDPPYDARVEHLEGAF